MIHSRPTIALYGERKSTTVYVVDNFTPFAFVMSVTSLGGHCIFPLNPKSISVVRTIVVLSTPIHCNALRVSTLTELPVSTYSLDMTFTDC